MLCSSSRTALLTCTIRLTCRLPDLSERSIRAALAVDSADLNEVASRLLSGGDAAATPVPVLAMMSREPLPPATLAGASLSAGASGEPFKLALTVRTARLYFHGVAPLGKKAIHPATGAVRYNLTFRKVR